MSYPPPGFTHPPPQPRGLRWVSTLTYLQFFGAIAGAIFGFSVVSTDKSSASPESDPDFGSVPLGLT